MVVGCPTVNRGILSSIAGLLEEIRGLGFRGKKAAAFGAYGWSGESPHLIAEALRGAGFEVSAEELKLPWSPGEDGLAKCREFGVGLARAFA